MTKIGPLQGVASIYELDIYDHVQPIDPALYGADGIFFNPQQYFITSGDAISKTKFLIQELTTYLPNTSNNELWQDATLQAIVGAKSMLEYLIAARGEAIFMETEWNNHRLYTIPKNPRNREEK